MRIECVHTRIRFGAMRIKCALNQSTFGGGLELTWKQIHYLFIRFEQKSCDACSILSTLACTAHACFYYSCLLLVFTLASSLQMAWLLVGQIKKQRPWLLRGGEEQEQLDNVKRNKDIYMCTRSLPLNWPNKSSTSHRSSVVWRLKTLHKDMVRYVNYSFVSRKE